MPENDMMKKYVQLRMKLNVLTCFLPALPVAGVFLIVALRNDVLPYDLLLPLVPLGIAALIWAIQMYQPVRFRRMIRRQEALFGVTFGEKKFEPLHPRTPLHRSPDWFISMGSWALYRGYVTRITEKRSRTTMGNDYAAQVETTDGRKYRFSMDAGDVKKLRDWWKQPEKNSPSAP